MKKNFTATASYVEFLIDDWLDTLVVKGFPEHWTDTVKKLARIHSSDRKIEVYPEQVNRFFQLIDNQAVLLGNDELSDQLSIEKCKERHAKYLDGAQTATHIYLNKIVTRLYEANPDILGKKPNPFYFHAQYPNKKTDGMAIYTSQWPPMIILRLYDIGTLYQTEDVLAWDLAHELIHLTLLRQLSDKVATNKEESVCDLLATVCAMRAGYSGKGVVVDWAQRVKLKSSVLTECLLYNKYNKTLTAQEIASLTSEDAFHLYDACERGIITLPSDVIEQLKVYQNEEVKHVHPHVLTRILYTNEMVNYLLKQQCVPDIRYITPIPAYLIDLIASKQRLRRPIIPKKVSPYLMNKIKKRYLKQQKLKKRTT